MNEYVSIIVPCYNEESTLKTIVDLLIKLPFKKQIIIVDDGSTDNTNKVCTEINYPDILILNHPKNKGKGAAIRTALSHVQGEITIIQDADLEYSPNDIIQIIGKFSDSLCQVVYGSRNLNSDNQRSYNRYYYGGVFLTWLVNKLYGSKLTDLSTCYKSFRTDLLRQIQLEQEGFDFCAEVTAKLLRKGIAISEVPISYRPRNFQQGKKIRWSDGLKAIQTLWRYRNS